MTQKSAVYIPIISVKKSRSKTNLSTVIYSGGRKGYPIWFASANQSQGNHKWNAFALF